MGGKTLDREDDSEQFDTTIHYLGPKPIADLKMRLADWLIRRGW